MQNHHDAFSQVNNNNYGTLSEGGADRGETESEHEDLLHHSGFKAEQRAESTISLFHQYVQWFTKHNVEHKKVQFDTEETMQVDTEVRSEAPEKVASYGKGVTGFVDTPIKAELVPQQDTPFLDQPVVNQETVATPIISPDERDKYKEGKTSKPTLMKELLSSGLSPEGEKQEPRKESPIKSKPHILDELIGDKNAALKKQDSPKKNEYAFSGMNLGQRKIVGPAVEEIALKQVVAEPVQEIEY